jgi:enterochelin esterase-like enzyme
VALITAEVDAPAPYDVTLTWSDPDRDRPAVDVLVRLLALTDSAQDRGDLEPYLMEPAGDGEWTWTARLPADLRTAYQLCPARNDRVPRRALGEEEWLALVAEGIADPAASDVLPPGCVFGNPGQRASVLSLHDAPAQPWREPRPSVPRGALERVEIGRGGSASVVHVYRAPGTETATNLALAILFDGGTLLDIDIAATFDNLVHEQAVDPLVAVLIESIRGSMRRGPTRVESLTAPATFESFVVDELLPMLADRLPVTDEPARSVVVGQSLGGLAALWLAHRHPGRFGSAVAQSSSLWWPGGDGQLSGDDVLTAYASSVPPLRLFVEVGSEETQVLSGNRQLRPLLSGMGDAATYREFRGGHDYACWRGGIGDGLSAVLGSSR